MKRVITLIMIAGFAPAVVAPVITAAPAQAAGIIECGNWVQTNGQPGSWHWSYGYSIPYSPARNLTTGIVSCSDARPFHCMLDSPVSVTTGGIYMQVALLAQSTLQSSI